MRFSAAVVLVSAFAVVGCGGPGDESGPAASRVIGMTGGTVIAPATGPIAGAQASIAAGSLLQPVTVMIAPATMPAEGGFSPAGPSFVVTPSGTALLESATVVVPTSIPGGTNVVVLVDGGNGPVVLTPSSAGSTVVTVTTTVLGTFQAVVVAPFDPVASTVTVGSSSLPADGVSAATIDIVVLDANGVGVPGASVTITTTGSTDVIGQPGPTDATGKATGTLTSSVAETTTISASVVGSTGGAPVVLGATPAVTFN